MQAYEFNIQASERGEVLLPSDIQKLLQERRKARVILLFDDDDVEWKRFTSAAFWAGYSEKDAAYDSL